MTDEVKKKRGRPKGKKDSPDITRPKQTERTQAQIDAQFKPGNKANADGWSMRKETRQYRKALATILLGHEGLEALLIMYQTAANNGNLKEFMELQRFMAEYAFGKPKEMLETEESVTQLSQGTETTPPLFGFLPGSFDDASQSSDDAYL